MAYQKQYIDWVLEAVNDLPNVVYEVANEVKCTTLAETTAWHEMVLTYLRSGMTARGLTHLTWITDIHVIGGSLPAGNAAMYNSSADLVSPTRVEGVYTGNPDQMKDGRCNGGSKNDFRCSVMSECTGGGFCEHMPPVGQLQFAGLQIKPSLLDNDHLNCIWEPDGPLPTNCTTAAGGITSGPDWIWKSTTRGYMPIYMDGWGRGDPPHSDYGDDGHNIGDPATRLTFGDAKSYMQRMMPLVTVVPVTTMTSESLALRNPGARWLIYHPNGGASTVDLTNGADTTATFTVEWWDVIDRAVKRGDGGTSTVTGGATRTLTPPSTITGPAVAFLAATPPTPTPTATPTVTGVTATPTLVPAKDWSARWWHSFGTRSAVPEVHPASPFRHEARALGDHRAVCGIHCIRVCSTIPRP